MLNYFFSTDLFLLRQVFASSLFYMLPKVFYKLIDALACDSRDGEDWFAYFLLEVIYEISLRVEVSFVCDDDLRLLCEFFAVFFELGTYGSVIIDGLGVVGRHYVDNVCEYCGSLYVFEKFEAQARSVMGTFDDAWYVSHYETSKAAKLDDAEYWLECCEGVVCDLRPCF